MIKIKLYWLIITIFCTGVSYSQQIDNIEKQAHKKSILTAESAQEKALEYLGFSKMEGFTKERNMEDASTVNISDDKTPFLHDKINDRDIWKVTYKNITLSPHRGYPDSVEYPRTFDVYIDPDSGTLLKIESIYNGTNINFAPEPSIDWAENSLKGSRYKFLGFASPDSNYVSFNDILNSMGPRNFKQLKAQLNMIPGRRGNNPFAVWFVIYRGTDPIIPKSGMAEPYNYTSFIYDAKTGKTIARTIKPSVEPEKLK